MRSRSIFDILKAEGTLTTIEIHERLDAGHTIETTRRWLWALHHTNAMQRSRNQNRQTGALDTSRSGNERVWWWEKCCPDCKGHAQIIYINNPSKEPWRCSTCNGRGIVSAERTLA